MMKSKYKTNTKYKQNKKSKYYQILWEKNRENWNIYNGKKTFLLAELAGGVKLPTSRWLNVSESVPVFVWEIIWLQQFVYDATALIRVEKWEGRRKWC